MIEIVSRGVLIMALFIGCGRDYAWEGVPEGRLCTDWSLDSPIFCLSEGHAFLCVVDNHALKVVCQRLSTDLVCTKIVDVETRCPAREAK